MLQHFHKPPFSDWAVGSHVEIQKTWGVARYVDLMRTVHLCLQREIIWEGKNVRSQGGTPQCWSLLRDHGTASRLAAWIAGQGHIHWGPWCHISGKAAWEDSQRLNDLSDPLRHPTLCSLSHSCLPVWLPLWCFKHRWWQQFPLLQKFLDLNKSLNLRTALDILTFIPCTLEIKPVTILW